MLYTADIGPLLTQLGLLHHSFADDFQAYVHTDPLAAETVLTQMNQAIDVLTSWIAANCLLLNPSIRLRPSGSVVTGSLRRLTVKGSPLSSFT